MKVAHFGAHSQAPLYKKLLLLLISCALALGLITLEPLHSSVNTANAYADGVGVRGYGGFVGSFVHSDGSQVYCLEAPVGTAGAKATGATEEISELPAFNVGRWSSNWVDFFDNLSAPALSGTPLQHMNWILANYGDTNDNKQAAAVQLALWELRLPGSSTGYQEFIAFKKQTTENAAPGTAALVAKILHEAKAAIALENTLTTDGEIKAISKNAYEGEVTVPAGTTELKAKGAKLLFNGAEKTAVSWSGGTKNEVTLKFIAKPEQSVGWQRFYEVSFSGVKKHKVTKTAVSSSKNGSYQRVAHIPTSFKQESVKTLKGITIKLDRLWAPTLTTKVPSEFIARGENFSDTVAFAARNSAETWIYNFDSEGNKIYAPIIAKGVLYGPFLSDPKLNPAASAPVGAPVAATATITTGEKDGPNKIYTIKTANTAQESGYYSWVWTIDTADQTAELTHTENGSLPVNYFFTDGFGQAEEGQAVPTELAISTQLSKQQLRIGDAFTDTVSVSLAADSGGWLQNSAGERIPAVLSGKIYRVTQKPTRSTTVPAEAEFLGEFEPLTLNAPNQKQESTTYTLPLDANGYITVVWCLDPELQPAQSRGLIKPVCDDFGVPSETAEILRPQVETQAQTASAYFGTISDTAIVSGILPDPEKYRTELMFSAYLLPAVGSYRYDENWQPVLDAEKQKDTWKATDHDKLSQLPSSISSATFTWQENQDLCMLQPVAHTKPTVISKAATYKSEEIIAKSTGTVFWVERLFVTPINKDTGSNEGNAENSASNDTHRVLLHQGECGIPTETTIVENPKVTTQAVRNATVGQTVFDTAEVSGTLSQRENITYKVTFEAFRGKNGQQPVCTKENLIFNDAEGAIVTAAGSYKSKEFKTQKQHIGKLWWVETLEIIDNSDPHNPKSEIVHRGECGLPNETTTVKAKRQEAATKPAAKQLAQTGSNPYSIVGTATIFAAAICIGVIGACRQLQDKRKQHDKKINLKM